MNFTWSGKEIKGEFVKLIGDLATMCLEVRSLRVDLQDTSGKTTKGELLIIQNNKKAMSKRGLAFVSTKYVING